MKKKILSLIVSVAMVMTVFAGMTVTASADDIAATTAFTVYLQGEDGTLTAKKSTRQSSLQHLQKQVQSAGSITREMYGMVLLQTSM